MSQSATAPVSTSSYFATVPPQEILPVVDSHFQSSIRGIYIVGDVTGMPLVKVAANQGAQVVAHMDADRAFEPLADGGDALDLVIIGGGPAGVAAAIEAEKRGLRYVVLERDKAASTIRSFPPGKKVYAEPDFLPDQSDLQFNRDLDRDEFLEQIDAVIRDKQIKIKEDTTVARIRQRGTRQFEIETSDGNVFPARAVLIAIGRQGQPRRLECPGAELSHKVHYRVHSPGDYQKRDVLVVGGGNSAIEAALLLAQHNRVTLSYRGDDFFRAKADNRRRLEQAERENRLSILRSSKLAEIREHEVEVIVDGARRTIPNDHVFAQIGTLPPVPFLMDTGIELDGIWTGKRLLQAACGLLVGFLVYFYAKHFVLLPEAAGEGRWLVPGLAWLKNSSLLGFLHFLVGTALPVAWLAGLGVKLVNDNLQAKGRKALVALPYAKTLLLSGAALYLAGLAAPSIFTIDPARAGPGPYYLPGFSWLFHVIPKYFPNLYGLYSLLYFTAITGFGLYWAWKMNHRLVWRRNLTIILTQWTLWWGIPTFLVVMLGRNPWTPLLSRSLNAWPLNMGAFQLDPAVGPGDPAWWRTVAVVGVAWAAILTFIVIPLFTIRWGKIYCSYICSCGALAETVGNAYRHRGLKGELPRKLERAGFVFIVLATIATAADLMGYPGPLGYYNAWVGTALAGAVAIGLYPFLGQRVWCRMWCPLAFWMNFWGRWSKFKITPEEGKCIDCNVCNQFCQMGIDIKTRALQGKPVTLEDTPCVGCAECVVRCPMQILHLGEAPAPANPAFEPLPILQTSAGRTPEHTSESAA